MILYKYAPINSHTNENLRESKLHFSTPSSFNDPFDIYPRFDVKKERELMLELFKQERILKYGMAIGYETKVDELSDDELLNIFHQIYHFNEVHSNQGITCFSRVRDNISMWSHYADKHSGICMGFKFDKTDEHLKHFFDEIKNSKKLFNTDACRLLPINYVPFNSRPPFTFNSKIENEDWGYSVLSTKYEAWKEEQEIRVMVHGGLQKIFPTQMYYKTENLKEVIFGAKSSLSNIVTIYTMLNNLSNTNSINYYIATLNYDKYALDINSVSKDEIETIKFNYNNLRNLNTITELDDIRNLNFSRRVAIKRWQKILTELNISDILYGIGLKRFMTEHIAEYILKFYKNQNDDFDTSKFLAISMLINLIVRRMQN